MRFVYQPEGAEARSWDFEPARLMSPEVETIERHTGLTFKEWIEACGRGSMLAIHGLLYVMLKRSVPTIRWDDVQFCMADVDFQMDDDEVREMRDGLLAKAADGSISDDEAELLNTLPVLDEPDPKED